MFEIKLLTFMKIDLVLNNRQWLMCHKTEAKQTRLRELEPHH